MNYCWNNKIQWLIVVQQSQKINTANLNCYNLEISPKLLNALIEVKDFFFPKKGEKQTRISVNSVKVNYTTEIPNYIRDKIHVFLKTFGEANNNALGPPNLFVNLLKYTNGKLQGEIKYKTHKKPLSLFIFETTIVQEAD